MVQQEKHLYLTFAAGLFQYVYSRVFSDCISPISELLFCFFNTTKAYQRLNIHIRLHFFVAIVTIVVNSVNKHTLWPSLFNAHLENINLGSSNKKTDNKNIMEGRNIPRALGPRDHFQMSD